MSLATRITLGLTVLVGLLFLAVPAYADDPSISVDSITFTPGGADVRETIAFHDLPAHTSLHYEINHVWGEFALSRSDGTACALTALAGFGDCSELSGSGTIYATFGRADSSFAGNDVGNVTVSVASL